MNEGGKIIQFKGEPKLSTSGRNKPAKVHIFPSGEIVEPTDAHPGNTEDVIRQMISQQRPLTSSTLESVDMSVVTKAMQVLLSQLDGVTPGDAITLGKGVAEDLLDMYNFTPESADTFTKTLIGIVTEMNAKRPNL